jgi:predicted RNA-binding Zn-ribbon protein involved in translation (DUF1610 family)
MKKEEITACPKCGSKNISSLKHVKHWLKRSGAVMGVYSCQECGYEGLPLILDSEEDYKRFLSEKQRENKKQD